MILPTHSRTSSSASSVGSSYVSSTDSNKTSHIESPTPSLQSHALDIVQNSDFHVNNGTATSSSSSSSSSSLPPYQSLCKLINEPIYNQNGMKNHHHNHHQNNNNHNEHDVASDTDHIDYAADLHHETTKFNNNKNDKLAAAMKQTNGNADDAIHLPSDDPVVSNGGENFAYKTLNGDVIRSVVPPGKGKSINYKVSNRCSIAVVHICVKWTNPKTPYDNAWTSLNNFHALFFVFSCNWN